MARRRLGRRARRAVAVLCAAAALAAAPFPDREAAELAFRDGDFVRAAHLLERHLAASPADGDARVRLGWCLYRSGDFAGARDAFAEEARRSPGSSPARVGLGYAEVQLGTPDEAASRFRKVLETEPGNDDALRGLVLAGRRAGAGEATIDSAIGAARRILASAPADLDAASGLVALLALRGGPGELRLKPDAERGQPLRVPARAGRGFLEVRGKGGSWERLFVAGINLGAALPGRHPTEFPEDVETWRAWLDEISGLGANAVRVYTLLPPAFYRALAERNASAGARGLWLIQGVWTELPPGNDFSDEGFVRDFESEIARVIDAVHGDLVLAPRPGHASGAFSADASGSLLAYIIGREWEPFAVEDYDASRPEETSWKGAWLEASGGRAMECVVARACDFAAGYEARRYLALHPLTFANWPTLDPLDHPTESRRAEEDAIRRKLGRPVVEKLRDRAWEDDAVSLDATKIRATPAMEAGFFAAYHVYPNFPDFLNLDPRYDGARDAEGPSRYAGYLRELKALHGDQPVLIAEFGVSTSRGIAHAQPEGWHHGGHDERRQGEIVARMLRAIRDAGMAGGIVFELQDEWFKSTWSVAPLESPAERRRLWFNAESPEQSYGLVANRPRSPVRVDGDPAEWGRGLVVASAEDGRTGDGWSDLRDLSVASDAGYVYLLVRTGGGSGPPDWSRVAYRIAIDTYDARRGERSLPPPGPATTPTGVEFLVEIGGPGRSAVTVSEPYEPFRRRDAGPVASPLEPSGRFAPLLLETNRERFGRDGTRFPPVRANPGELRFGSLDPGARDFDTRADVAVGVEAGAIEIRIPWGLLSVGDPSSRRVVHQEEKREPPFGTVETEGFRMYAFVLDPSRAAAPARGLLPVGRAARPWVWEAWERPEWTREIKLGAGAVRKAMAEVQTGGTTE